MKVLDWLIKNLMRGIAYVLIVGILAAILYILTTVVFVPFLGPLIVVVWFINILVTLIISGWTQGFVVNKLIK